ncbi:DUF6417 family protein [Streptomyces sp. NPDC001634]|uniref:DUF6417 family protein n=1 Tax=Streptomyces sp. NPDC001634 TaxID=3154390 RepID=UPI00331B03BD
MPSPAEHTLDSSLLGVGGGRVAQGTGNSSASAHCDPRRSRRCPAYGLGRTGLPDRAGRLALLSPGEAHGLLEMLLTVASERGPVSAEARGRARISPPHALEERTVGAEARGRYGPLGRPARPPVFLTITVSPVRLKS